MKSILIVDDEEILRFTFGEFLREGGYEISGAANYDDALKKLGASSFDLIITDIILGGKTGIDLLEKIKDRGLNCPVIVLTGFPEIETAAKAVALGAFNYLSKPVDQKTLLNSARVALKYKEALDKEEKYRFNLDAIFKSVREGIVTVDRDMNIVEANEASFRICGLGRSDIGKKYNKVAADCKGSCLKALEETLKERKSVQLHRIECGKGHNRGQLVSVTTSPLLYEKGLFAGAVMVISDETRIAELEQNLKERRAFRNIIGESARMQSIYTMIETLADVDTTVLISGESGTGKELVAEALHYGSGKRGKGPLVFINCAAIPENLMESEIFGHERGAFTGAHAMKRGKFELASGGTMVLDEIGDMPLLLQGKLLRVLEQSEIQRVGGERTIKIDVRLVASTNKDLRETVAKGQFREDLYYRLKVVEITMPPLRDRLADIKLLTDHFINKFNVKFGKDVRGVSKEVERLFLSHNWPGNVRELQHVIEHAFIICDFDAITMKDLPEELKKALILEKGVIVKKEDKGAEEIIRTLEEVKWNRSEAAKLLGIDRSTLYRKMKAMKIQ
ncbi:MAG: sigma 54-interacting transcriptional regulator [bacterium]|nr:sigma 54-interacting transcriptional regulator [bacterium]